MSAPHPQADLIKAWADGQPLEMYSRLSMKWVDMPAADSGALVIFCKSTELRLKPDPYQHLKDAIAAGKKVQADVGVNRACWIYCGDPRFTLPVEKYRIVEVDEVVHGLRDNDTGKVTDMTIVIEHVFGEIIGARVKESS